MSWLGFLTRLIPFAGSIDDIAEAIGVIVDPASSLRQRGEATQKLIGLLIPILEAVVAQEVADEAEAVTAMKLGDGRLIGRLKDFLESPMGKLLLELLLGQLKPA